MNFHRYSNKKGGEKMLIQITLGDIISWIVTIIAAVGIITVNIKLNINSKKTNQSKSIVKGDQVGGNKIGGDNHVT